MHNHMCKMCKATIAHRTAVVCIVEEQFKGHKITWTCGACLKYNPAEADYDFAIS